jgi:dephospho-CoA kinase
MGKSTTAQLFRDAGVPVWDADAAVHELYAQGGAAVPIFMQKLPSTVIDGSVSRDELKKLLSADPEVIKTLESIVHPLVAAHRAAFLAQQTGPLVVFDIPLLFETGADAWLTTVLVVTAPADIQKARVMARGRMKADIFNQILARQMPDREKRAKADHIIETVTLDATRAAVQKLISELTGQTHA